MAVKSLAQSSVRQAPPVNSMLAGYRPNQFHLLETVRLGANTASVTFSNLQRYSDYQHFQIRAVARMTYSDPERSLTIQFNGDTATNYYMHGLYGNGSSVGSYAFSGSSIFLGSFPAANATGSVFTGCVTDILDPFEAKTKVVRSLAGTHWNQPAVSLRSGMWVNTAAITSITLVDATSNLVSGSRFSLYGIKARS
jgi:hypothetical protein